MTMVEGAVTFRDVMARLAAAVNVATAVSGEGQHTGALVLEGALVSFDRTIVNVVEFATQSASCAVWSISQ
jgi:flavin reductase (DIM6/NTAB) family NADH-FMN oxidoreductase RutF